MEKIVLDGQAFLENEEVPFHYENNILKLYFEHFSIKEGTVAENDTSNAPLESQELEHLIRVRKRGMLSGGYYLMHMESPLAKMDILPFPHTSSRRVNWFIDSFDSNAKYHEMRFRFDELSYFLPSHSKVTIVEDKELVFDRSVNEIFSGNMKVGDIDTEVKLVIYSNGNYGVFSAASAKTISEIRISFEPTDDYEFFYKLFLIVSDIFSFICNRRNLTLESADILGSFEFEGKHPVTSTLVVSDKYKEQVEESRIIAKTTEYRYFEDCFGNLIQLIASNYDEEDGTVSIKGLHPSTLQRQLIDLRQSINITSAFEYHVRKFMPEISSADTLQTYEEIKKLIQDEYVDKVTGKKKKVAKQIINSLQPVISLGDKVKKAIKGYDGWPSLESVVSERFSDWEDLARIVNDWRNELAHEKRKIHPTYDTIRSVRMVEHLNYAIILRVAGYSNEQIKAIVDEVLIV